MKTKRFASTLVIVVTLALGILIGTVVATGVKGKTVDSTDATPLQVQNINPQALSNAFTQVAKQIEPAVVNINTESTVKNPHRRFRRGVPNGEDNQDNEQGGQGSEENPFQDFFDRFFGGQNPNPSTPPEGMRQRSLGSGVIVDSHGYIVTNFHVVEKADRIRVNLMGDPPSVSYNAKVIGSDRETDLAVLKIEVGRSLPAAKFGNSQQSQVGEWVLAVGSPFGLNQTVTAGIISAIGRNNIVPQRQFQSFIQTDAAINPGNSGGPLVNMAGQVIGINTAIYTESSGYQGVGFAMPSDTVVKVYKDLVGSEHKVVRGSIGVMFNAMPDPAVARVYGVNGGITISDVEPKGPAGQAGLQSGDTIIAVEGQPVKTGDDLVNDISNRKPGSKVRLTIVRGGSKQDLTVTIADREKLFGRQLGLVEDQGDAEQPKESKLGVSVRTIPPEMAQRMNLPKGEGVMVQEVKPGGFADSVNLSRGDVIMQINRQPITDEKMFDKMQSTLKSGQDVVFLVRPNGQGRNGSNVFVAGTLP
jgi:serine protease Do